MNVSVVVGNPKPQSRTLEVATALARQVASDVGGEIARIVDLSDYAGSLFTWPDEAIDAVVEEVAASDIVVVASPTYKAAYTGMLKAFLDRYPGRGLAGVTAIPVMTGGAPDHAMAVDTALRPLLVELGASVPTSGLYFLISRLHELDEVVSEWAQQNADSLGGLRSRRTSKS